MIKPAKPTPAPRRQLKALTILLLLTVSTLGAAQTLTGTATNGTSGKPAAGDEIILISLSNGMEETAKTKADGSGKFSFTLPDAGPHLIRAVHQGVTYHQMAPPGTPSVEIQVYDVSKKLDGINVTADVSRYQADGGQLQGTRLFAVNNESSPKKTQMNDHNFEFYLPAGAKIGEVQAKAPNGQPISAEARPSRRRTATPSCSRCAPAKLSSRCSTRCPIPGKSRSTPSRFIPRNTWSSFCPSPCSSRRQMRRSSSPCRIPARATPWSKSRNEPRPGSH